MLRRVLIVGTMAAIVSSASPDLTACGDKFVRAGRSARTKGYAAIHRASILIYKPNGSAKGLKLFQDQLRKAGHKPVALKDEAALSEVLASTKFDVVITDYANTTMVMERFRAVSAEPGVLPILHEPTKAQETEARKQYHCIIRPEKMTEYDALEEIDHLMQLRLKPAVAAVKVQ
jgi:hypothetical protein